MDTQGWRCSDGAGVKAGTKATALERERTGKVASSEAQWPTRWWGEM